MREFFVASTDSGREAEFLSAIAFDSPVIAWPRLGTLRQGFADALSAAFLRQDFTHL